MRVIKPLKNLQTSVSVPADKSISHRAVILSALAKGKTVINPFLRSEDTLTTLQCLRDLGVDAQLTGDKLTVLGQGMILPAKDQVTITANESGTTMRVLSGVLVSQQASITFEAKPSLAKRPMARIVKPLLEMGADISGVEKDGNIFAPLKIKPVACLSSRSFNLSIASAQVKSALLLAGLYADDQVSVTEPFISRDHTERMLSLFKVPVLTKDTTVTVKPVKGLITPKKIFIPGDFSSAAFFIVLGIILKKSRITLPKVNINPTRIGLLSVLKRMAADITVTKEINSFEPHATIIAKSSSLVGTTIEENEIPLMIDEVPILCAAAAFAQGTTVIKGIAELRVKETDRVSSMVKNLASAGVKIFDQGDKLVIEGGSNYKPAVFNSFNDHRTAMSMIVFGAALDQPSTVDNTKCIDKSFPEFISIIDKF